ncbi:histidine phosphatase superfamily [Lipomyces kononenkoae]|uniref:Histidine phosphatase superfamily n=1 Tax=Lipomyces kononenkoae TaxID=34357 RepID=A0ACC3SYZ9_LIPKO
MGVTAHHATHASNDVMGHPIQSKPGMKMQPIDGLVAEVDRSDQRKVQIFIVRHGQTRENAQRIIQGHLNTNLNEEGIRQSRLCGEALRKISFDAIWSSDLNRCIQTRDNALRSHLERLPDSRIHTTELLRERGFGDVEGHDYKTVVRALRQRNLTWETVGESTKAFQMRLLKAWDEVISEARMNYLQRVIIISHGGAISSLVHILLKRRGFALSDQISTGVISNLLNTSITIVNVALKKDGTVLNGEVVEFNNAYHLQRPEPGEGSIEEEIVDNF